MVSTQSTAQLVGFYRFDQKTKKAFVGTETCTKQSNMYCIYRSLIQKQVLSLVYNITDYFWYNFFFGTLQYHRLTTLPKQFGKENWSYKGDIVKIFIINYCLSFIFCQYFGNDQKALAGAQKQHSRISLLLWFLIHSSLNECNSKNSN